MIRVYLAGNVFETEYRENVKKQYGSKLDIVDPLEENGAVVDTSNMLVTHIKTFSEIVENDKALIDTCQVFVAYVTKYSAGTMMEILYAFNRNIPVYVIVPPGKNFEIDIWISYHTTKFFYDWTFCFNHILNQLR